MTTTCARCKGTAIDPENSVTEDYGDGVTRHLPEPCAACQLEPTDPALRDRLAAALADFDLAYFSWEQAYKVADVVLAVRDGEVERMRVLVAASESPGQAVRLAAQYADRAIENGERAAKAEAAIESSRLALSLALDLGTGAPWDAIRDRAAEVVADARRAPADRAAVLREAATAVRRKAVHDDEDFCLGIEFAADELVCLADEVQQPEPSEVLVHVGWWCWQGGNHGHLAALACRSDSVPLHAPAEWADEMRAVIQRIEDGVEPDLTEQDVDQLMADGIPVRVVAAPPATYSVEAQQGEGLSGPCDCGEGAVHYTAADCPAARRKAQAETSRIHEVAMERLRALHKVPPGGLSVDESERARSRGELTATLVIGRTSSHCGNCGKPTLMEPTHHTDVSGWTPRPGGGCGARFTAMCSDSLGVTDEDLKAVRPDLPIEAKNAQQSETPSA